MEDLTQLNLLISPQGDPAVAGAPIGDAAADPSLFQAYLAQAGREVEGESGAASEGGTDLAGVLAEAAEIPPEIDSSEFQENIPEVLERFAEHAGEELAVTEAEELPVSEVDGPEGLHDPAPAQAELTGKAPVESPRSVSHADSVPVELPVPEAAPGERTPAVSRAATDGPPESPADIKNRPETEVAPPIEPRSGIRAQDTATENSGDEPASRARVDVEISGAPKDISVSGPAPRAAVSLERLDLEGYGVRKLAIELGAAPQKATALSGPETASIASGHSRPPELALRTELPSSAPAVVTTRPRDIEGTYRVNPAAEPEAADLLARLEARINAPRPTDTAPRSLAEELPSARIGIEGPVTSHPVWKEVALASRQVSQAKSALTQPSVVSSETKDAGTIVHMSADVQNQSDRFERQGAPQPVAPPQPAKPVPDTTFSLEPARRVTMVLGDSEAQVHVQIRDHQGEVSLRFDAPSVIRSGLEGSIHNLVESLSREQVPVADVLFSGRFDRGTDSNDSQGGKPYSSRKQTSTTAEAEDASFTTEFESSAEGSLINVHA